MATVNDVNTTEAPPRVTATVEVGGETLTVDSATPGSAMRANGVQVGIPERLGQEEIDAVVRRLSMSEVPAEPVTGNGTQVTGNAAAGNAAAHADPAARAIDANARAFVHAVAAGGARQQVLAASPSPPAAGAGIASPMLQQQPMPAAVPCRRQQKCHAK